MRRKLLRIKLEGCEVVEVYVDSITGFDICFCPDLNSYLLSIMTINNEFIICDGNFDTCHSKLNNIHKYLEAEEEIINLQ